MSDRPLMPTPGRASSPLASTWELIALGFLLALATATPLIRYRLYYGDIFAPFEARLYQAAVLAFNYFESGPIRRGLAGSIVYLLGHDIVKASTWFFLLSAGAVALPVVWLYRTLALAWMPRCAFAATIVAIMLRWAGDIGRTDMLVAAGIAAAAIATTHGRLGLAALMLGIGLMIHETSLIFAPRCCWRFSCVQAPGRHFPPHRSGRARLRSCSRSWCMPACHTCRTPATR